MATTTGAISLPHADGEVSGTFTYDTVTRVVTKVDWANTSSDDALLEVLDNTVLAADGGATVVRTVSVPAHQSGSANIPQALGYTFPQKGVNGRYGIRLT